MFLSKLIYFTDFEYKRIKLVDGTEINWGKFNSLGIDWNHGVHDHPMLRVHLPFVSFYIPTSKRPSSRNMNDDIGFGFCFHFNEMANLFLYLGSKVKIYDFPFVNWEFEKKHLLDFDTRKIVATDSVKWRRQRRKHYPDEIRLYAYDGISYDDAEILQKSVSRTFSYKYTLKSGVVQERQATIHLQQYVRYRKWFPFLKKTDTSIDVQFSDEVGERTGSWKGGTTGCGYTLLPNENPEQCLRRMEVERKF